MIAYWNATKQEESTFNKLTPLKLKEILPLNFCITL